MGKEELRKMISETTDDKVKDALWELYDLKFNSTTAPVVIHEQAPTIINTPYRSPYWDTVRYQVTC